MEEKPGRLQSIGCKELDMAEATEHEQLDISTSWTLRVRA